MQSALGLLLSIVIFRVLRNSEANPDCSCVHDMAAVKYSGCRISKGAPSGYACKCISYGLACRGEIIDCPEDGDGCEWDETSNQPTSAWACKVGGGDCETYRNDEYMAALTYFTAEGAGHIII